MIGLEQVVAYCMEKPAVIQVFPFDIKTMVFKTQGKIFLLLDVEKWNKGFESIRLKNKVEKNTLLRRDFTSIVPAYHMNKKHWNSIYIYEGELELNFIYQLIDASYEIVKASLSKKDKKSFL